MDPLTIQLQTLTPIWTGGIDPQKCDRIHETSIIGSIRWWYEAVVRGLGVYACDPTSDNRCPDKENHRCLVCELFGCTGWSRKFRLRVLDENEKLISEPLQEGIPFKLEFLELRPITDEEKWLLINTFEVICNYGAIGGRTVLKPQNDEKLGQDYGIVKKIDFPPLPAKTKQAIKEMLHAKRFHQNNSVWPDLRWFFFVKGAFLERIQMNYFMGLNARGKPIERERPSKNPTSWQRFLRGSQGKSKKIFSFHGDREQPYDEVRRVWGYVENDWMLTDVIQKLSHNKSIQAHLNKGVAKIKTGREIIDNEF